MTEERKGQVHRVIFSNPETGYAVLEIDSDPPFVAVGNIAALSVGEDVTLSGGWQDHPRHGIQFHVEMYRRQLPTSEKAIERYLVASPMKGIGKVLAARLVRAFGRNTLRMMREEPGQIAKIKGISAAMAQTYKAYLDAQSGLDDLLLLLGEQGIHANRAMRIYDLWGAQSVEIVRSDPYRLASEIDGFGFATADKLALAWGLEPNAPKRVQAGIQYILGQSLMRGDTWLLEAKVLDGLQVLLDLSFDVLHPIATMLLSDERYRRFQSKDGSAAVAFSHVYEAEAKIAELVRRLVNTEPIARKTWQDEKIADGLIADAVRKLGFVPSPEQKEALKAVLGSSVLLLTGGPGTGKTTLIRVLAEIASAEGLNLLLAAPTGRAARRMQEATGVPAQTLHRLLDLTTWSKTTSASESWLGDVVKTLESDLLVVDESSMIDLFLAVQLLAAVPAGMRLVLIGDADQLPPVGPGLFFRDLLDDERIPRVRLKTIFRQDEDNLLVQNAYRIIRGEQLQYTQTLDSSFLFIPRDNDEAIHDAVLSLCSKILPETYGLDPLNDVQVLAPMRRGDAGVLRLNDSLQALLAPTQADSLEIYGKRFALSDKVIQTRNDYNLTWITPDGESGEGVMNGETGVIASLNIPERQVVVLFDDERRCTYDAKELSNLELAYAITIHKSQGSEYPCVVLALGHGPPGFLSRNLLYTGVTRAKKLVIVVGKKYTVESMIRSSETRKRNTLLPRFLRTYS